MSAGKHLTQAEREKIIALAAEGYAMQSIARRFEVGLSCVYHIVQKLGRRKTDVQVVAESLAGRARKYLGEGS